MTQYHYISLYIPQCDPLMSRKNISVISSQNILYKNSNGTALDDNPRLTTNRNTSMYVCMYVSIYIPHSRSIDRMTGWG